MYVLNSLTSINVHHNMTSTTSSRAELEHACDLNMKTNGHLETSQLITKALKSTYPACTLSMLLPLHLLYIDCMQRYGHVALASHAKFNRIGQQKCMI